VKGCRLKQTIKPSILFSNDKIENLSGNRQSPPLEACRIAIVENVSAIMTLHLIPYPHSTGFVHVCDDTEMFVKIIIFKDHSFPHRQENIPHAAKSWHGFVYTANTRAQNQGRITSASQISMYWA
jgi:hypothetical protein